MSGYLVNLDAYVPLGHGVQSGRDEVHGERRQNKLTAGHYRWSRPANFAWIDGQEVRVSANLAPAPESATVEGTYAGPHPFRGSQHRLGPGSRRVHREGGRRRRNEPVNRVGRHQNGDADPDNGEITGVQVP